MGKCTAETLVAFFDSLFAVDDVLSSVYFLLGDEKW